MLLVLGLGQCSASQSTTRKAYVAAFVIVLLYTEVPWAELLLAGWYG